MKISIQDIAQMHRDFYASTPRDLVDDLAEEDPQIAQESLQLDTLLAKKRQELEKSQDSEEDMSLSETSAPVVVPQPKFVVSAKKVKPQLEKPKVPVLAKDTLVTRGWNDMRIKGRKNWADFENLIYLYALGQLFTAEKMPEKAKQDKAELTYVVEEFDRLKRPQVRKHFSAQKRLASTKTYILFGKKVVDASCLPDMRTRAEVLSDLEDEYCEAISDNEFNGLKLKKAYHIARHAIRTLRQRY